MAIYTNDHAKEALHERIHDLVKYNGDDLEPADLIQLSLATRILDCSEETLAQIAKSMTKGDLFSRMGL